MQQEAQEKNITLVRKPRGADSFIHPKFGNSAEGLEMKWDFRIQAWEIVTRRGRVEFRIGRVVNGEVMVTFYVNDNQPAEDDLSNRAARWMDQIRRRGDDLGEWVADTPAPGEVEESDAEGNVTDPVVTPARVYGKTDTKDGAASWLLLADEQLLVVDLNELESVAFDSLENIERTIHFILRKLARDLWPASEVKFNVRIIGRVDPHLELVRPKVERHTLLLSVEDDLLEDAGRNQINRVIAVMNMQNRHAQKPIQIVPAGERR